MRTVAEIDRDIAKVTSEMQDIHGTTTEVYARIVGYYRSVRNWNKGKREEYNFRQLFVADKNRVEEHLPQEAIISTMHDKTTLSYNTNTISHYELFVRKTCPNCPPVKECCTNLPYSGEFIDVDTEKGLALASEKGIFSAPTVIFYNENNDEISRAHSVNEIKSLTTTLLAACM